MKEISGVDLKEALSAAKNVIADRARDRLVNHLVGLLTEHEQAVATKRRLELDLAKCDKKLEALVIRHDKLISSDWTSVPDYPKPKEEKDK